METVNLKSRQELTSDLQDCDSEEAELILRRIRLAIELRRLWLEHVFSSKRSELDTPTQQKQWELQSVDRSELDAVEERIEALDGELARVVDRFELDQGEADLLQLCFASQISPTLRQELANLKALTAPIQSTEALAGRLFGHGRAPFLRSHSPLFRWKLIESIRSDQGITRLLCDSTLVHWLRGRPQIDPALVGKLTKVPVHRPMESWPVKSTAERIVQYQKGDDHRMMRVVVTGPEGSGRKTFIANLCKELGLKARSVVAEAIKDGETKRRLQRQVLWDRFAPVWIGAPLQLFGDDHDLHSRDVPQFVVLQDKGRLSREDRFRDLYVELPPLSYKERRDLLLCLVDGAADWPDEALDLLAMRNSVQLGDIVDLGLCGIDSVEDATDHLSARHAHRLGDLARRLPLPFAWEDLVVSSKIEEDLQELVFEATDRAALFARPETGRLFPYGRGLAALFHGPPGTGKTMAAQIVARELTLDLYRVDLSSLISKYIGETMSQVRQLLDKAALMDAVLLFDEADSLFSKRTDVNDARDRHANTDTNFLLQALEEHEGVVLLASNRRHQLDAAFTRRFRYVLEFASPQAEDRRVLWDRLLAALAGGMECADLDKTVTVVSEQLELTGAEIKSSILSAVFLARRQESALHCDHILEGIERELNKSGSGLSRRQRRRLLEAIES